MDIQSNNSLPLNVSEFLVRNSERFRTTGLILSGTVAVILFLWSASNFVLIYAVDAPDTTRSRYQLRVPAVSSSLANVRSPISLEIGNATVFKEDGGVLAAINEIENVNDVWKARTIIETNSITRSITILPGQKQYVYWKLSKDATQPIFNINEVVWERIDRREHSLPLEAVQKRSVFFQTPVQLITQSNGTTLRFSITNNSPFNWRQLQWSIIARIGTQIVGFRSVNLENFVVGESRSVIVGWQQTFPSNLTIERLLATDVLSPEEISLQ